MPSLRQFARQLASQEKFQESLRGLRDAKAYCVGKPERLYAIAKEMATLDRQMAEKTGHDKIKSECTQAAVATLCEAIDGGLSKDRLQDASLRSLSESPEFRNLAADSKPGSVVPANNKPAEISRVN